jgi:hypothetical protein
LLAVGLLLGFGLEAPALILGGVLVAVCALVTTTNCCVPSTLLGIWWRSRGATPAATLRQGRGLEASHPPAPGDLVLAPRRAVVSRIEVIRNTIGGTTESLA